MSLAVSLHIFSVTGILGMPEYLARVDVYCYFIIIIIFIVYLLLSLHHQSSSSVSLPVKHSSF